MFFEGYYADEGSEKDVEEDFPDLEGMGWLELDADQDPDYLVPQAMLKYPDTCHLLSLNDPLREVAMPLSARTDDCLPCGLETPLVCERRHEPVCETYADDQGRTRLDTRRPVALVVACQTSLPDAKPGLAYGLIELHERWRRRQIVCRDGRGGAGGGYHRLGDASVVPL